MRAVYNHAFRLTGNWPAAEEVVSLTFLEAWRLRGTIRPEGGSLLPWLLGIALNVARNASRASRRHQAALTRLPQARTVPDFADELAGRLDDAAQLTHVRAAMRTLPGRRAVPAGRDAARQFIGEKTYDPKTGRLTGESAILQRGFTARTGQRP